MSYTFHQVASAWKADKRQWVKKSTYATYTQLTNNYILPRFGDGQSPDEAAIQAFINDLLGRGLSLKTVQDTMVVLRNILRFGSRLGAWPSLEYTVHFPTRLLQKHAPDVLSRSQQIKLLNHLREHFSFPNLGILICLHSGLRIGEICALQWRDLDVAAGVIHVTKTVQRIYIHDDGFHDYSLSIDRPKTATSVRDVPVTRELSALLRPLKKIMQEQHFIVSNDEKPMEPRYLRDHYRRLLRQLDIPVTRFHTLRHTFATRCIESRCDYKTVSVLLGHSNISTTLNLYVHPGLDEKKKAVEQMLRRLSL